MKKIILLFGVFAFAVMPSLLVAPAVAAGSTATFGDDDSAGLSCSSSFLGFPAWFDGLPRKTGTCEVEMPMTDDVGQAQSNLSGFIFTIILNVIEIALRLVGFAAVGFVIYGGFKYLTSAGSADRIVAGRKIIQNALIGLVVSFFSVAIVNLIASNIN